MISFIIQFVFSAVKVLRCGILHVIIKFVICISDLRFTYNLISAYVLDSVWVNNSLRLSMLYDIFMLYDKLIKYVNIPLIKYSSVTSNYMSRRWSAKRKYK